MDRFYLGKLVDDVNRATQMLMQTVLGEHLIFFLALDDRVEVGESHLKYLRYLYSMDQECPIGRLLGLQPAMEGLSRKFTQMDTTCTFHFGYDNHVPAESEDLSLVLQFYLLDPDQDSSFNKTLVAGLMEDPDTQLSNLPPSLHPKGLTRSELEDEILNFCQHYVSRDFENLFEVRDFEAAFWRIVNLACGFYEQETYIDLVGELPPRFRPALENLPEQWHELRQKEKSFNEEDFVRCSRNSFRFCQHLMDLGA